MKEPYSVEDHEMSLNLNIHRIDFGPKPDRILRVPSISISSKVKDSNEAIESTENELKQRWYSPKKRWNSNKEKAEVNKWPGNCDVPILPTGNHSRNHHCTRSHEDDAK